MKAYANKSQRDVSFAVGNMVHLKLKAYRLKSLAMKLNEKLNPRFYGPFKVLERVGKVA